MGGLVTELKMDPIDALDAQPAFLESLKEKGMLTHLKWVFRVLEYIVKFSRVRTGRSRAAWFPLMDRHGHDYQRSLGGARVEGGAVAEGYSMGTYDDQPFYTTVMNNVSYVEFMNRRFGIFTTRTSAAYGQVKALKGMKLERGLMLEEKIPQFEQYGEETWNDFFEHARVAFEKRDGPGSIEPIEVPPPMAM